MEPSVSTYQGSESAASRSRVYLFDLKEGYTYHMKLFCSFIIGCVAIMLISFKTKKVMDLFHDYPVYRGNDLGVTYTPSKTVCKVWAPGASAVKLRLYLSGDGGKPVAT